MRLYRQLKRECLLSDLTHHEGIARQQARVGKFQMSQLVRGKPIHS